MLKMKYDDDMLKQISDSVDLFEYVSKQITLVKKGDDYFGHCPLHTDRTPSFSITPSKNAYYCFGCTRSGGILGYLCDYENMRFEDAVEKAARLANVNMDNMCRSDTVLFLKKLRSCNRPATEPYVHAVLDESEYSKYPVEEVKEWLDEGIEQRVMDLFDIRVDNIKNRILYPVRDIAGRLINIKARTRYKNFKELKLPKYINYFQVGCMDYFQSLSLTLPYIKEKREVIVFESIKSVMKAYGWGVRNCVSAEKHTLTKEQILILARLGVDVVFAYDSDVDYRQKDVAADINKLKRIVNVYLIDDRQNLLGGEQAKNSPADCGKDVWLQLYSQKRKVV